MAPRSSLGQYLVIGGSTTVLSPAGLKILESFHKTACEGFKYYTSAIDNYCWKGWKGVFEGCAVFSVAFRLNISQRTPPSDITIISIVLTNQIPETAVVDLWSFVEIFSKKLETHKHPNWIIY